MIVPPGTIVSAAAVPPARASDARVSEARRDIPGLLSIEAADSIRAAAGWGEFRAVASRRVRTAREAVQSHRDAAHVSLHSAADLEPPGAVLGVLDDLDARIAVAEDLDRLAVDLARPRDAPLVREQLQERGLRLGVGLV